MFKNTELKKYRKVKSIDYSTLWINIIDGIKSELSDKVTEDYFISFIALHKILNMSCSIEEIDDYELDSIIEVSQDIDKQLLDNGLDLDFLNKQYGKLRYKETKFVFNNEPEEVTQSNIEPKELELPLNEKYSKLILNNMNVLNEDLIGCILDSYLLNNMNNDKR